jgi:histidinol-phosphate aminotransferase
MVGELARRGVVVRSCRSFEGLSDHYIRANVGEDWENEQFIAGINAV